MDIEVSDEDFITLSSLLEEGGIEFKVQIDDVQKLIEEDLQPVGARRAGGDWHSEYHRLEEVCFRHECCIMFIFRKPNQPSRKEIETEQSDCF